MVDALVCPLCGERNACGMAEGKGACWCFDMTLAEDVLSRIPDDARNVACVCRRCASRATAPDTEIPAEPRTPDSP